VEFCDFFCWARVERRSRRKVERRSRIKSSSNTTTPSSAHRICKPKRIKTTTWWESTWGGWMRSPVARVGGKKYPQLAKYRSCWVSLCCGMSADSSSWHLCTGNDRVIYRLIHRRASCLFFAERNAIAAEAETVLWCVVERERNGSSFWSSARATAFHWFAVTYLSKEKSLSLTHQLMVISGGKPYLAANQPANK
jgi:hypothetical protein